MYFTYVVIFKYLLGPGPMLHFEHFEQKLGTLSLATWADGRFIQQIYC